MLGKSASGPAWWTRRQSPATWSPRRTRETARNRRHRPTPIHEAAAAKARLEVHRTRGGTLNRMEDHLGKRATDRGPFWTSSRRSFGATCNSARLNTRSVQSSIGLRSVTASHAKRCQLVFRGHGSENATAGSLRSHSPQPLRIYQVSRRRQFEMSTPGKDFSWDHGSRGVISPGMPRRTGHFESSWRRRPDRARLRRQ